MEAWVRNLVDLGLTIVLVGVGGYLVIRGIMDFGAGFGKEKKDVKVIIWGIVTGIIGAIMLFWGASNAIAFFQGLGNQVPKS